MIHAYGPFLLPFPHPWNAPILYRAVSMLCKPIPTPPGTNARVLLDGPRARKRRCLGLLGSDRRQRESLHGLPSCSVVIVIMHLFMYSRIQPIEGIGEIINGKQEKAS
jgi:hypothetical protein